MSLFRLRRFISNPSFLIRFYSHSPPAADGAISSFHRMLRMSPAPPVIEFNEILGSLVKMNHCSTAVTLAKQLESERVTPDLATFSILINSYCHLGQMNSAFSALATILKRGYHPDTITLTTLLQALCLNGGDDVIAKGFQLDQVACGILINELCKAGETTAALQLMRQIEDDHMVQPDVVMYSTIIDNMCQDKHVSDAYNLYNEMLLKKISPDVFTYNALIDGFSVGGQLAKALGLFNVMKMENIKPDVYTFDSLVYGLCKQGKLKQANSVLAVMIAQGLEPNVVIYNSLLEGYCLIKQINKAQYLFNTMATRGVIPDVHSYNIMIDGLCEIRTVTTLDKALDLFEEMRSRNITPDAVTYTSLIEGWFKVGRYLNAFELLEQLHDTGHPDNITTYNCLVDSLCKDHTFQVWFKTFKECRAEGVEEYVVSPFMNNLIYLEENQVCKL